MPDVQYKGFTSYPTSIITRIETLSRAKARHIAPYFLPHFHYNKDWNAAGLG